MKALLLALCLLPSALCLPSYAVDWALAIGDEESEFYVDNDSIKTNGVDYMFTTKTVNYRERYFTIGVSKISCANATFTLLTGTTYNLQGRRLGGLDNRKRQRELPILERTGPAVIYQSLCQ